MAEVPEIVIVREHHIAVRAGWKLDLHGAVMEDEGIVVTYRVSYALPGILISQGFKMIWIGLGYLFRRDIWRRQRGAIRKVTED